MGTDLPYLDRLNAEQARFARHVVLDPHGTPGISLQAAAGSGKTRTVVTTIACLLARGTDPASILATTFTSDAGKELSQRLSRLVGQSAEWVQTGTFHSLGLRALRQLDPDPWYMGKCLDVGLSEVGSAGFRLRSADVWKAIVDWRKGGVPGTGEPSLKLANVAQPKDYAAGVGLLRAQGHTLLTPSGEMDTAAQKAARRMAVGRGLKDLDKAWLAYAQAKRALGAFDFSDVLCSWLGVLRGDALAGTLRPFAHVLVDEGQDNNWVQLQIGLLLAGRWVDGMHIGSEAQPPSKPGRLYLVGDTRQCIYSWRGAVSDRMLEVVDQAGLEELSLTTNYRSAPEIVDVANRACAKMDARTAGQPSKAHKSAPGRVEILLGKDSLAEGYEVVRAIQDLQANRVSLDDIAILVRTNAAAAAFEGALMQADIRAWRRNGVPFFSRWDVLAYSAYAVLHTEDWHPAWAKILNRPKRYLSRSYKIAVGRRMEEGQPLVEAMAKASHTLPPSTRKHAKAFLVWLTRFRRMPWHGAAGEIARVLLSGQPKNDAAQDDEDRKAVPKVCADIARRFDSGLAFQRYADHAEQNTARTRPSEPCVTISTVHGAKGQEYEHVFVSMPEKVFPHARSVSRRAQAEEVRLAYVALTRAKTGLYVTGPGQVSGLARPVREVLDARRGENG